MQRYNLDTLVKVLVHDFYPARYYHWSPAKKWLGITIQKEGIYDIFNSFSGIDYDQERYILKDNILLEKPEVILCFVDGTQITKYFETKEAAEEYASQFEINSNWKKL